MYLTGTDLKTIDFLDMDEVKEEGEHYEAIYNRIQDDKERDATNDCCQCEHQV